MSRDEQERLRDIKDVSTASLRSLSGISPDLSKPSTTCFDPVLAS